jgi:hypothetical protein
MSDPRNPIRPGDGDPRHGTLGGYTNHRCRCPECREANRIHCVEEYIPRIRATGLPDGDERHGTYNGYRNYRCRCEQCRAAHTEYSRNYAARMRGLVADGLR